MISFAPVLQLLLCVVCISAGQLLFRAGALKITENGINGVLAAIQQPIIVIALFIYASATLLWIHILRSIPLTLAYPFAALAFAIVPLLSYYIFNDPINLRQLCGIALIILGIIISGSNL